jgi:poly(hydroxyalkanoate) depolymerase family esterase
MAGPRIVLLCALAALTAACGTSESIESIESNGTGADRFELHEYSNAAGTRSYKLFVPGSYDGAAAWPLIVELHGCGGNADEEARWSRFNELATQRRMLVVYPEQDPEANGSRCWNWFQPDHQARDAGEPSLIAGITRTVMEQWNVDARRVYVGGISAGGAMATNIAVTYPDLYAAAMIYAGCEYKGTTCTGAVAALPPEVSGELAYQAMGAHARVVPVLVVQGDQDPLVPFPNAELVVRQFLASDDWADDGSNNGSIAREPAHSWSGTVPGGRSYSVDEYRDAGGCVLAQRWLIHGMGHQWSGAQPDGSARDALLTDPLGPDITAVAADFFLTHPMPEAGPGCLQTEP